MHQSEKGRFSAALTKMLQAVTGLRDVPNTMIGAYWQMLREFTWPEVAKAITQALRESNAHMTPSGLRAMVLEDRRAVAEETREQRYRENVERADGRADVAGEKRFGQLWYNEEFQDAKRVANMEYSRRVCGVVPGGERVPTEKVHGYVGPFDYMLVVLAAELPRSKGPDEHARVWENYWRLLAEEFQLYLDDPAGHSRRLDAKVQVEAGIGDLVDSTKPPYNQGVTENPSEAL